MPTEGFLSCFLLKVITFIDLAGHERYLKTTIFGMTGHVPDFAMLMVSKNVLLFEFQVTFHVLRIFSDPTNFYC